jgi:S-adenosylmethionine synthetase
MELVLRRAETVWAGLQPTEVVERKGLGHPDTICDAIAEQVCVRLCRHYLERFGQILHHNVDKVLLVGGSAHAWLGGGEVTVPIEIYLAGRATWEHGGERVPIHELAIDACDSWLRTHLPGLNVDHDVRIISRLRPGSDSLTGVFARSASTPLANDTSCGVGFAPLTDVERMVLVVEQTLNALETKRRHPAIGQDIKVMAIRNGARVQLTISAAIMSQHVHSVDEYEHIKTQIRDIAIAQARQVSPLDIAVVVNAADRPSNGELYLTVTGTSAESGDDGEVGRGNRTNGLITPYRPMTMEAVAGKNPFNHVGKIYNRLANRIATELVKEPGIATAAECILVSAIGQPVSEPQLIDVRLGLLTDVDIAVARRRTEEVVSCALAGTSDVREAILSEERSFPH